MRYISTFVFQKEETSALSTVYHDSYPEDGGVSVQENADRQPRTICDVFWSACFLDLRFFCIVIFYVALFCIVHTIFFTVDLCLVQTLVNFDV